MIALFGLYLLCGCEDALTVKPENSLTYENGLSTPKDFESFINGIDKALKTVTYMNEPNLQIKKGVYVDEYYDDSEMEWAQTLSYPSSELSYWNTRSWQMYYEPIASANVVLTYADAADLSSERRDLYKGQAWFYKALLYLEIIHQWGDCMLIRDQVELLPTAKTAWDEVADYAIDMATKAAEALPEFDKIRMANGNVATYKSIPCKGSANALLAHLCAWKAGGKYFAHHDAYDEMELWKKAEEACTQVITSGQYDLAANPEEVCTSVLLGGSRESIYETITRNFWNEDILAPVGPKHIVEEYAGWPVFPTSQPSFVAYNTCRIKASSMKEMYPQNDLRRESYFYKLDSMSHDTLLPVTGGYAYMYKYRKFYTGRTDDGYIMLYGLDQNKIWWRLADIYLLRAECRARLGGSYVEGAIDDLNKIRKRAGAKLYDASEYGGDLRYAIFKEREKELLLEGQRYYDIIRNDYVRTELRGNFRTVTNQDLKDGALFLMIGSGAFNRNPLLRQNAYWHRRL